MKLATKTLRGTPALSRTLLAWLLTPLFILLVVSAITTHRYATHLAETERDLALEELADDLKDAVIVELKSKGKIDPDSPTLHLLLSDSHDQRYFAVYNDRGIFLGGDARLPKAILDPHVSERAVFSTLALGNDPIRLAAMRGDEDKIPGYEILLAETMNRRNKLVMKLSRAVLIPQALAIFLVIPLVLYGIRRGLRPLDELRDRIVHRTPQELNDLSLNGTPRELLPVIAALNNLLSRVRQSQDELRHFTADAAHQIKTPLAALKAEIELALTDPSNACALNVLQRMGADANRLAHLVQQLLVLAHTESKRRNAMVLFDLTELAKEVTETYLPTADARHIDLGFDGPDHTIPIRGNAVMLREAMKNLVENALKFTPVGGIVTVSVSNTPPIFSVADSGPGIPPDERTRIFHRFHRSHDSTAIEGSGLGLAIVKQVALGHMAKLGVGESALGGAEFSLQFPDPAVSQS
jgi:two-component system sensor histidine kinase TctE